MNWRDYLKPGERRTLERLDKLETEAAALRPIKRQIYDRCRKRMATAKEKSNG